MSSNPNMQDLLRALALLLARMEQRENQLHASLQQRGQAAHAELQQLQHRLLAIVGSAQASISEQASAAMAPAASEYRRVVAEAENQLRRTSRIVWGWYLALAGLALILAMLGGGVLGYYQRELAAARDALARHDNALPVLQAFQASDASLCDGHLCIHADATAPRYGQDQQYIRAKAR
ncbi:MAG: hypothetical protein ACI4NW_03780 [Stenotrophomonas sp.]